MPMMTLMTSRVHITNRDEPQSQGHISNVDISLLVFVIIPVTITMLIDGGFRLAAQLTAVRRAAAASDTGDVLKERNAAISAAGRR